VSDNEKHQRILDAGLAQFCQYGYRRTSMNDIAEKADVSRASLYSYFKNKDEIFRSVSVNVHEILLRDIDKVLRGDDKTDVAERVFRALFIRHSRFLSLVVESDHGSELEDEYSRLCGDVVANANRQFEARLTAVLEQVEADAKTGHGLQGVTPADAATILNLAAAGCKRRVKDVMQFEQRIRGLASIYVKGATHSS